MLPKELRARLGGALYGAASGACASLESRGTARRNGLCAFPTDTRPRRSIFPTIRRTTERRGRARRGTLCVSTQIGCALACRFCHTGTQPFVRNLTSGEILAQLFLARDALAGYADRYAASPERSPGRSPERSSAQGRDASGFYGDGRTLIEFCLCETSRPAFDGWRRYRDFQAPHHAVYRRCGLHATQSRTRDGRPFSRFPARCSRRPSGPTCPDQSEMAPRGSFRDAASGPQSFQCAACYVRICDVRRRQ